MRKNGLLPNDTPLFQAPDDGARGPSIGATTLRDDGDPFPLAYAANGALSLVVSAQKPVASIATLADYLVNGFWQYNSTVAHHFASNVISYNITGLNAAEQ